MPGLCISDISSCIKRGVFGLKELFTVLLLSCESKEVLLSGLSISSDLLSLFSSLKSFNEEFDSFRLKILPALKELRRLF